MSAETTELSEIKKELATISLALSVLAVHQTGSEAANASERQRNDELTRKGLSLLMQHIEEL